MFYVVVVDARVVGEGVVVIGYGLIVVVAAFIEETGKRGGLTDPIGSSGEEGGGGDECGVERVGGGVGEAAFGVRRVLSGGIVMVVEREEGEGEGRGGCLEGGAVEDGAGGG